MNEPEVSHSHLPSRTETEQLSPPEQGKDQSQTTPTGNEAPVKPNKSPLRKLKVLSNEQGPPTARMSPPRRQASTSAASQLPSDSESAPRSLDSASSSYHSSSAEVTPPSSSFLSVTGSGRKRAPSDASSGIRAMSTWFTKSVTDDDDDEENASIPASPTGLEWPVESGSLLERAREALLASTATEPPLESPQEAVKTITPTLSVRQGPIPPVHPLERSRSALRTPSASSSKRAATLPVTEQDEANSNLLRSQSVLQGGGKVQRSPSKLGGGGILNRLRRISRKEKRAATMDNNIIPQEPLEALLRPPSLEGTQTPELEEETEEHGISSSLRIRRESRQSDIPIQNASRERTPIFADERVQSIHSVQPSLVDDESILGRDSPPISPMEFDDDDDAEETWEEPEPMPDTPVEGPDTTPRNIKVRSQVQSEEIHEQNADDQTQDDGWHMQSVPGSFLVNSSPASERKLATPPRRSTATSIPDVMISEPSPLHHRSQATEYQEALSRQASEQEDDLEAPPAALSETDENEAITPRAIHEPSRSSYFDAPSTADLSTTGEQLKVNTNVSSTWAGFASLTVSTSMRYEDAWLDKARLAHEERHYLIRFLLMKQLTWEIERLFLVRDFKALDTPTLPDRLPKSDATYLKASPGYITPDLPIMRLLTRHILLTCPIFSAAVPIEGSAAERTRATNAVRFFDEGVLPLCRFLHAHSIAKAVDVNGEWPTELFDAPSTMDLLGSSVLKVLVRFLTALVDGRGHGFLWSKVPSPTAYEYVGHRTTLNMLKQGGMEVNVVSSRFQRATGECEFILAVRRFGFPPAYVIRSESDFYNFARSLAQELGPQVRVRPVPAPDGDSLILQSTVDDVLGETDSLSSSTPPPSIRGKNNKGRMYDQQAGGKGSTGMQKTMSQSSFKSSSPVSMTAPNNLLGPNAETLGGFGKDGKNKSSTSLASTSSSNANQRRSIDLSKPSSSTKGSIGTRNGTRLFKSRSNALPGTMSSSAKNMSMTDLASLTSSNAPITTNEEARRRQMRSWLRDTLSIRGAGHAQETRHFLQNDAYVDRDLRPGTRRDILSRLEVDEASKRERERTIDDAPREVIELRTEISQLWNDCVEGQGVERAFKTLQQHDTFSSLPLPYQRVVSWSNLQLATFLHHVFLDSHEARQNFDRLQEFVAAVPWRMLSLALRERTGLMMQKVQSSLTEHIVRKKLLAVFLQDSPSDKVQAELATLKKRLGSTVMRKLDVYANSSNWQRSIIRRAAEQAEIPLVAAIMRGSDRPLLGAEGIKKVIAATRVYQEFMQTQPTYAQRKTKLKANVQVRLIYDMQRALRLLCLQRDGKAVREAVDEDAGELKPVVEALIEPLLSLLRRLHRSRSSYASRKKASQTSSGSGELHGSGASISGGSLNAEKASVGSGDVVMDLQQFCLRLLDVLAGARARVQDPWRNLSTITLLLDDAVPSWYQLLHSASLGDSLVYDISIWLQNIANLLQFHRGGGGQADDAGKDLLARFWPAPTEKADVNDGQPLQKGGVDRKALEAIVENAWRKRTRQLEVACRWSAGEVDGDMDIQIFGEGGKTRTTGYELPKTKLGPSAKIQSTLLRYMPGFREAVERLLGADPGTAW